MTRFRASSPPKTADSSVSSTLLTVVARIGYGARGVVYLHIGGLSFLAALDLGGQTVGTRGTLRAVLAQPFGFILVGAIAGGIACLALWRIVQALMDPSRYGRDLKGLGIRAALGASALVYIGIVAFAVRLMLGWAKADPDLTGPAVASKLSSLLDAPFGLWITGSIGLVLVGMGVTKLVKAWRADVGEHLVCGSRIRLWAVPISQVGLTARGFVFILIGASVITAAIQVQADRASGLAGILGALEEMPYGWVLLVAVALGLASFGVFGLIEAMYRRIEAKDID
jgi:hypothetical protein